jgi:hypothetical protein
MTDVTIDVATDVAITAPDVVITAGEATDATDAPGAITAGEVTDTTDAPGAIIAGEATDPTRAPGVTTVGEAAGHGMTAGAAIIAGEAMDTGITAGAAIAAGAALTERALTNNPAGCNPLPLRGEESARSVSTPSQPTRYLRCGLGFLSKMARPAFPEK